MNIPNNPLPEIWQVDVNGQIYEASFEELTQWIAEGALLPQDKVRRGKLRWLEAGKIPSLYGFFNAKELGVAPPPVLTIVDAGAQTAPAGASVQLENLAPAVTVAQGSFNQSFNHTQGESFTQPPETQTGDFTQPAQQAPFAANFQSYPQAPPSNACNLHPGEEPKYICDACQNLFCKTCPKSYGGTVKVCPTCGSMCRPIEEFQAKQQKAVQYHSDLSQGFGFEDFGKALAYPFKFRFSLVAGALLFMFFSLGQNAAAIGSKAMIASAIFCGMMANALTFGCLANTVDNMSQGRLAENFMPNFEDFSLWDDVIHPFFLSIGAYLASFGLLIVLIIGMAWYTFNAITAQQTANFNQINQQFKEALPEGRVNENGEMILTDKDLTPAQRQALEDKEIEELQSMIQESRRSQLESVVGKTPETRQKETQEMLLGILKVGVPFLIFGFLALLWGLFYFPAACAVAGYTRSFGATINPLVGLDTIKRMGVDYVKILGMCLLVAIMSGVISGIIAVLLSPFDLPALGNLPAKAIGSLFTFYFSVVFSVFLGYALYKNSAKLNLYR